MQNLEQLCQQIQPVDQAAAQRALAHIDGLVKPIGSLGRLEALGCQLSAIYRSEHWPTGNKKIYVMGADHGVFAEDIAVTPREVTAIQAVNTVNGLTGVAALAGGFGITVEMIDVGIDSGVLPGVTNKKVARGCGNIACEAAMSRTQLTDLLTDIAGYVCADVQEAHWQVIGIGELGMANTTPAAAIVSAMTGQAPEQVVGLGANYPSKRLAHKVAVVQKALDYNQPDGHDALDVMAKVGGFELAAMSAAILGGAAAGVPVVLDGFLTYASALVACAIEPKVWDYLIPSHRSAEKGSAVALKALNLTPYLEMDLRLGEGSGAVLAMPLVDAAHAMMNRMGSLAQNGLNLQSPS